MAVHQEMAGIQLSALAATGKLRQQRKLQVSLLHGSGVPQPAATLAPTEQPVLAQQRSLQPGVSVPDPEGAPAAHLPKVQTGLLGAERRQNQPIRAKSQVLGICVAGPNDEPIAHSWAPATTVA